MVHNKGWVGNKLDETGKLCFVNQCVDSKTAQTVWERSKQIQLPLSVPRTALSKFRVVRGIQHPLLSFMPTNDTGLSVTLCMWACSGHSCVAVDLWKLRCLLSVHDTI